MSSPWNDSGNEEVRGKEAESTGIDIQRLKHLRRNLRWSRGINWDLLSRVRQVFRHAQMELPVNDEIREIESVNRDRSRAERRAMQVYLNFLMANNRYIAVQYHFPDLLPDGVNDVGPFWNLALETPLKWNGEVEFADDSAMLAYHFPEVSTAHSSILNRRSAKFDSFHLDNEYQESMNEVQQSNEGSAPSLTSDNSHSTNSPKQIELSANLKSPRNTHCKPRSQFEPSRVLLGKPRTISNEIARQANEVGYNLQTAYQGEVTAFTLENAGCRPEDNCSVFVTNIDPAASDSEIFDQIYEGAVFSYHRNPIVRGQHQTCAATLVFKNPTAAQKFILRGRSIQGLSIRGRQIRVVANRDAVCPRPEEEAHQSRVVKITGPGGEFNAASLVRFFESKLSFNLIKAREYPATGDFKTVELAFASIRGQSRVAFRAFAVAKQNNEIPATYSIGYDHDPCDRGVLSLGASSNGVFLG